MHISIHYHFVSINGSLPAVDKQLPYAALHPASLCPF